MSGRQKYYTNVSLFEYYFSVERKNSNVGFSKDSSPWGYLLRYFVIHDVTAVLTNDRCLQGISVERNTDIVRLGTLFLPVILTVKLYDTDNLCFVHTAIVGVMPSAALSCWPYDHDQEVNNRPTIMADM
jgi:hypothetical protein